MRNQARAKEDFMELILTYDEVELLDGILEHRHRELLKEIAHTDHHEFRKALRKNEKMLESILSRLRSASVHEISA
jgi:hypothetical protein